MKSKILKNKAEWCTYAGVIPLKNGEEPKISSFILGNAHKTQVNIILSGGCENPLETILTVSFFEEDSNEERLDMFGKLYPRGCSMDYIKSDAIAIQ